VRYSARHGRAEGRTGGLGRDDLPALAIIILIRVDDDDRFRAHRKHPALAEQ
jgi:hypothetical protein